MTKRFQKAIALFLSFVFIIPHITFVPAYGESNSLSTGWCLQKTMLSPTAPSGEEDYPFTALFQLTFLPPSDTNTTDSALSIDNILIQEQSNTDFFIESESILAPSNTTITNETSTSEIRIENTIEPYTTITYRAYFKEHPDNTQTSTTFTYHDSTNPQDTLTMGLVVASPLPQPATIESTLSTSQSMVDVSLEYLDNPAIVGKTLDLTTNLSSTQYFKIRMQYKVVAFDEKEIPIDGVSVLFTNVLGKQLIPLSIDDPNSSFVTDFYIAQRNSDGSILLKNKNKLKAGDSGYVNFIYNIDYRRNFRNTTVGSDLILSNDDIKMIVDIQAPEEPALHYETEPLSFRLQLRKDTYQLSKYATRPYSALANDPQRNNASNYSWAEYSVSLIYNQYEIGVQEGVFLDTLPDDAFVTYISSQNGTILYNAFETPKIKSPLVVYTPNGNGSGGKIEFTTKEQSQSYKIGVRYPTPSSGAMDRTNTVTLEGYYYNEAPTSYEIVKRTSTIDLTSYKGFSTAPLPISFQKTYNGKSISVQALRETDQSSNAFTITPKMNVPTDAQYDYVVGDDTVALYKVLYDANGQYLGINSRALGEDEYYFDFIRTSAPYGITENIPYELYIRYKGMPEGSYALYDSGTFTTNAIYNYYYFQESSIKPTAFKLILKDVTSDVNNRQSSYDGLQANVTLLKTSQYTDPSSSEYLNNKSYASIVNVAYCDVFSNGISVLQPIDWNSYYSTAGYKSVLDILEKSDIQNYGKYQRRSLAGFALKPQSYPIAFNVVSRTNEVDFTKGAKTTFELTVTNPEATTHNFQIVSLLTKGVHVNAVTIGSLISADNDIPWHYETIENYKGTDKTALIITVENNSIPIQQILFYVKVSISDLSGFVKSNDNYYSNDSFHLFINDIPYSIDHNALFDPVWDAPSYRTNSDYVHLDEAPYYTYNSYSPDLYPDINNDGIEKQYVKSTVTGVYVTYKDVAGTNGMDAFVDTDAVHAFVKGTAATGFQAPFEYKFSLKNKISKIKGLEMYTILPFSGDTFQNTDASGNKVSRNSAWTPTLEDITLHVDPAYEGKYTIYYAKSTNPGTIASGSFVKQTAFVGTMDEVKAIAIAFEPTLVIENDKQLDVVLSMRSPSDKSLAGKTAFATFYINGLFSEDGNDWAPFVNSESNAVGVSLGKSSAKISNMIFLDANRNGKLDYASSETGMANVTVELWKVDSPETPPQSGQRVQTTTTGTYGEYYFMVYDEGYYAIRVRLPNDPTYIGFSPKYNRINLDNNTHYSYVNEDGFSDVMPILFGNAFVTYDFPYYDAGIMQTYPNTYQFRKRLKEPTKTVYNLNESVSFYAIDVKNGTNKELSTLVFEDQPQKGLILKSMTVPAYKKGDFVSYRVYYKTANNSQPIQIGSEPFSAATEHKITFPTFDGTENTITSVSIDFGQGIIVGFEPLETIFFDGASIGKPIQLDFQVTDDFSLLKQNIDDPFQGITTNDATLTYGIGAEIQQRTSTETLTVVTDEINQWVSKNATATSVTIGEDISFTITDAGNYNNDYVTQFEIIDQPETPLLWKKILVPAFEQGNTVSYQVLYNTVQDGTFRLLDDTSYLASVAHEIAIPSQQNGNTVSQVKLFFGTVPTGFKAKDAIETIFYTSDTEPLYTGGVVMNRVKQTYLDGNFKKEIAFDDARVTLFPLNIDFQVTSDPKGLVYIGGALFPDLSDEATSTLYPGQPVVYTFTIENKGLAPVHNLQFKDLLPPEMIFVDMIKDHPDEVVVDISDSAIVAAIDALAPGEIIMLKVNMVVAPLSDKTLSATVTQYGTLTFHTNQTQTTASIVHDIKAPLVTATILSDPAYVKENGPTTVAEQTDILYTLQLHNDGLFPAKNVWIKTLVPHGVTYVENDASGVYTDGTLTFQIQNLAPGEDVPLRFTYRTNDLEIPWTPLLVQTDTVIQYESPQIGTEMVPLLNEPQHEIVHHYSDLSMVLLSDPPSDSIVTPENTIVYHIQLTNRGNTPAKNVVVTAPIPEGTTYVENSAYMENGIATMQEGVEKGSWLIPSLKPQQHLDFFYTVRIDKTNEEQRTIDNQVYYQVFDDVSVSDEGLVLKIPSNNIEHHVQIKKEPLPTDRKNPIPTENTPEPTVTPLPPNPVPSEASAPPAPSQETTPPLPSPSPEATPTAPLPSQETIPPVPSKETPLAIPSVPSQEETSPVPVPSQEGSTPAPIVSEMPTTSSENQTPPVIYPNNATQPSATPNNNNPSEITEKIIKIGSQIYHLVKTREDATTVYFIVFGKDGVPLGELAVGKKEQLDETLFTTKFLTQEKSNPRTGDSMPVEFVIFSLFLTKGMLILLFVQRRRYILKHK